MPNTVRGITALALATLALGGAAETASAQGLDCPTPSYRSAKIAQVAAELCRFNLVRAGMGIPPLAEDPNLGAAAQEKLDEIIQYKHVSHTPDPADPSPFTPLKEHVALSAPWSIGENIAIGTSSFGGPRNIFKGWWLSPAHRANILNPNFAIVGFAEKHVSDITMDVDQEDGPTLLHEALHNETIWVAEFASANQ